MKSALKQGFLTLADSFPSLVSGMRFTPCRTVDCPRRALKIEQPNSYVVVLGKTGTHGIPHDPRRAASISWRAWLRPISSQEVIGGLKEARDSVACHMVADCLICRRTAGWVIISAVFEASF